MRRGSIDYHVHTHVSHDGAGTVAEYARRAEEIDLAEVCFTEHLDFYSSLDGLTCRTIPEEPEIQRYLEEVREARQGTGVRLRAGLEIDYKPEADRWVRDLVPRLDLDFALGSVHNVGHWSVSGPAEQAHGYFDERGAEQGCLDYLEVVEQAVATGLFDSFAHLDLMKRFRPENSQLLLKGKPLERIVAVLERMASVGIGLEINAGGLAHLPREPYPSLALLRLARDRGVTTLTPGSDAHRPETLARGLDVALSLAHAAGYTHLHTFERRVPTAVEL